MPSCWAICLGNRPQSRRFVALALHIVCHFHLCLCSIVSLYLSILSVPDLTKTALVSLVFWIYELLIKCRVAIFLSPSTTNFWGPGVHILWPQNCYEWQSHNFHYVQFTMKPYLKLLFTLSLVFDFSSRNFPLNFSKCFIIYGSLLLTSFISIFLRYFIMSFNLLKNCSVQNIVIGVEQLITWAWVCPTQILCKLKNSKWHRTICPM